MGQASTSASVRGVDGRVYAFGYKGVKQCDASAVGFIDKFIEKTPPDPGWLYEVRLGDYPPVTFVYIALGHGMWVQVEPGSFHVNTGYAEVIDRGELTMSKVHKLYNEAHLDVANDTVPTPPLLKPQAPHGKYHSEGPATYSQVRSPEQLTYSPRMHPGGQPGYDLRGRPIINSDTSTPGVYLPSADSGDDADLGRNWSYTPGQEDPG